MPNIQHFAKALHALHKAKLLKEEKCKDAVKMFIRRATETKDFHATTHYRSKAVERALKGEHFSSRQEYHAFCKRHFRHEHIVPCEAIYKMIVDQEKISERFLSDILRRFGVRATITLDEDKELKQRSTMPPKFYIRKTKLFHQPLARYINKELDSELVRRDKNIESWIS